MPMAAAALMAACAVGPNYHRPDAPAADAWQPAPPWQLAAPGDAALKGAWWELFQDEALSALIEQSLKANENLKVAAARLDQARDQLTMARADLFPTVSLAADATRGKTSAHRPLGAYGVPNQSTVQNDFKL